MALPVTHFTHDGRDYYTTLLPASEALVLLPKLIAAFGDGVTSVLLAVKPGETASAIESLSDPLILGPLLQHIASACANNSGLLILRDVLRHTECAQIKLDGGTILRASVFDNFDHHFAGDLGNMLAVCIKAAQASFAKPSGA